MTDRVIVIPPALKVVYDNWHFAPAVISDGLIFCSGIVGTSADGEKPKRRSGGAFGGAQATLADESAALAALVAVRDPQAQFETAFEALGEVLAEAGAGFADIIELTSYHVGISRHMAAFMAVKDRYLRSPTPPGRPSVSPSSSCPEGWSKLRAVARVGSNRSQ